MLNDRRRRYRKPPCGLGLSAAELLKPPASGSARACLAAAAADDHHHQSLPPVHV